MRRGWEGKNRSTLLKGSFTIGNTLYIYIFIILYIYIYICFELVTQSCLTLCDPVDCSPPGSSVHGILQARILEWVAISFSRGSFQPRDWTHLPHFRESFYQLSHQGSPYTHTHTHTHRSHEGRLWKVKYIHIIQTKYHNRNTADIELQVISEPRDKLY